MLKIYFDDVLIDNDYYPYLDNDYKLFDDNTNFRLGATSCNTFKLSVDKSVVSSHPSEVRIDDGTSTFYLIVDNIEEEKYDYTYTLVDELMKFNFYYDAKPLIDEKQANEEDCYLSDIWHDMCNQAGVEYDDNYVFLNDIVVNWYDNRKQAREYLSYIAELQYGYAQINEDGKSTFKRHNSEPVKIIDIDECRDFVLGEGKTISRVVFDNGLVKYEFGDDTGATLYLNPNNVYITNEAIVEKIYNELVGFTFYNVSVPRCPIDSSVRAGDIIVFTDGINNYPTIAQYSLIYNGGWSGGYSLSVNTEKQQETQIIGLNTKVRNIQSNMDYLNNEMSIIAEEIEGLTDYIRTVGTTGAYLKLPNTPNSNGAINKLSIKGFELMPLYPNMAYPSDYTYPGVLNFYTLIFSNELVTYSPELPIASEEYENMLFNVGGLDGKFYRCVENEWIEETDLTNVTLIYVNSPVPLQKLGSVYDELLIEANKVKVIQRIGYDFDNEQWSVLSTPITHELDDVLLPTFDGDTFVTFKYFDNLTFNAEYIIKNDLTSVFSTQLESKSQFKISQDEISSKVSKDNLISEINQTAEKVKIKADKIDMEGLVTAINNNTTTTIDGDKVRTGSITSNNYVPDTTGMKIDLDNGTIDSRNLKLKEDGELEVRADIFLPDGGKVVGGDGILTNLMFSSAGGETPVGWVDNGSGIVNWALDISYIIPSNFTITEAYVTLYHVPVKYSNSYWGYSRAVKLFKVINYNRVDKGFGPLSIPNFGEMSNVREITNAFGSSGFTAQVATDQNHVGEQKVSANISSSFSAGEHGVVLLKTTESRPSSNRDAFERTGQVFATLNIIGYMSH